LKVRPCYTCNGSWDAKQHQYVLLLSSRFSVASRILPETEKREFEIPSSSHPSIPHPAHAPLNDGKISQELSFLSEISHQTTRSRLARSPSTSPESPCGPRGAGISSSRCENKCFNGRNNSAVPLPLKRDDKDEVPWTNP
jgi:hypothetical protein